MYVTLEIKSLRCFSFFPMNPRYILGVIRFGILCKRCVVRKADGLMMGLTGKGGLKVETQEAIVEGWVCRYGGCKRLKGGGRRCG